MPAGKRASGTRGNGGRAVVSGQWSVVGGQWSVVGGQWSVERRVIREVTRWGAKNTFCPRRATKGHEEHLFDPRWARRTGIYGFVDSWICGWGSRGQLFVRRGREGARRRAATGRVLLALAGVSWRKWLSKGVNGGGLWWGFVFGGGTGGGEQVRRAGQEGGAIAS